MISPFGNARECFVTLKEGNCDIEPSDTCLRADMGNVAVVDAFSLCGTWFGSRKTQVPDWRFSIGDVGEVVIATGILVETVSMSRR
jgi:hypothetical protein